MAAHAAATLLLFAVIPVWIAAGLADYLCHRAAHIENTSGPRESVLHLLQLASVGAPLAAGLLLEIDAGLLALMLLCIAIHHLIAYIDIAYANSTRRVAPLEQMVHSFLEITPITAFLLVGVLHWPQLQSLFGAGPADFGFRLKQNPLPTPYVAGVLAAAVLFDALPYLEELARSLKYASGRDSSIKIKAP